MRTTNYYNNGARHPFFRTHTSLEQEHRVKILTLEIPPLFDSVGHVLFRDSLPFRFRNLERPTVVVWMPGGTSGTVDRVLQKSQVVVNVCTHRVQGLVDGHGDAGLLGPSCCCCCR
jgi:hypothetical protein